MFIGPLLTGFLTETMGYYYMNLCLGKLDLSPSICNLLNFGLL
jgi:hypothetical protein